MISRTWDFGDGNTATALAPVHRYEESGIYTVSLTISTSGEDLRAVKENYIVVRSVSGIRADFNFNTTGGASPYASEAIQFFDTSESGRGDITSWAWDFGDGATSDEQNPAHAYAAVGAYTVTLTVASDYGTDSKEKSLEVVYRPPTAIFDAMPTEQWSGNPVLFIDMSVAGYAPIVAWVWNFGDGETSEEQNPLHAYANPGTYTITLTVISSDTQSTSASFTRKDFINILQIPEPPDPDFSYAPRLALTEERVFFEASNSTITDEPILEYAWDFGDGEFNMGRTVSHSYAEPGKYTVTLTVLTESTSASEACAAALEEFQESPGIDELRQATEFCGVSVTRNITVDRAPVAGLHCMAQRW